MKYLLTKSKILDLNYTFVQNGSGSVDNVTYSVPAHSQGVLSVDAQGKVTALVEQGTGIVEIKSGNALLESVAIEVMPLADYNIAMGIKTGSTPLSVSSSVAVAPQGPTLITGGTVIASSINGFSSGYPITDVFAGIPGKQWDSIQTYQSIVMEFVGKQFSEVTAVKKVRARFVTAPSAIAFEIGDGAGNWSSLSVQAVGDYYNGGTPDRYWKLDENHVWLEFNMPVYNGSIAFRVRPATSDWASGVPTDGGYHVDRWRVGGLEFYE